MNQSITRRQFFASLIPSWITKRVLSRAVTIVAAAFIGSITLSVVRSIGAVETIKVAGYVLCALVILWVFARLVDSATSRLSRMPVVIQAIVAVTMRVVLYAIAAVPTIMIYQRWKAGEDMTGVWVSLAIVLLMQVMVEMEKKG